MSNKTPIVEFPVETTSIDEISPVGVPFYWPCDTLPSDRFIWVEGQEFDVVACPKLALRYPTGRLPDPRWDFFRCVGRDQTALAKHAQSVQPLGFKSDPHSHPTNATRYATKPNSGWETTYQYNGWFATASVSAAIVTGTITGTGTETKPQCMLWYCIMRIR